MNIVSSLPEVIQYTDTEKKTGLTVFIPEKRSSCAYYLCGSAPALRDVSTLDVSMSNKIDALLFQVEIVLD